MKNLNSGGTKSGKIPFINKRFYTEPQTITVNMTGVPNIKGAILVIDSYQRKEYVKVKSVRYPKDGGSPIVTYERL